MGKNRENVLGSKVGWKFRCGKEVWKIYRSLQDVVVTERARAQM